MIIGVLLGYGEASPVLRTTVRRRGGHSVAGSVNRILYDRCGDEGRLWHELGSESCALLFIMIVKHYRTQAAPRFDVATHFDHGRSYSPAAQLPAQVGRDGFGVVLSHSAPLIHHTDGPFCAHARSDRRGSPRAARMDVQSSAITFHRRVLQIRRW